MKILKKNFLKQLSFFECFIEFALNLKKINLH